MSFSSVDERLSRLSKIHSRTNDTALVRKIVLEVMQASKALKGMGCPEKAYANIKKVLTTLNLESLPFGKRYTLLKLLAQYAADTGNQALETKIQLLESYKTPFDEPAYVVAYLGLIDEHLLKGESSYDHSIQQQALAYVSNLLHTLDSKS